MSLSSLVLVWHIEKNRLDVEGLLLIKIESPGILSQKVLYGFRDPFVRDDISMVDLLVGNRATEVVSFVEFARGQFPFVTVTLLLLGLEEGLDSSPFKGVATFDKNGLVHHSVCHWTDQVSWHS